MFFNGQYRRTPAQNLGGTSQNVDKNLLIQRAAEERQQRQEQRAKLQAVQTLQSHWRRCVVRLKMRKELRTRYDNLQKVSDGDIDFDQLFHYMLYFYHKDEDVNRLVSLGQLVIRNKSHIAKLTASDKLKWSFRIRKFVCLFVPLISDTSHLTISLRIIEVLTDQKLFEPSLGSEESKRLVSFIWLSLVSSRLMLQLRKLIDSRVPEPYEEVCRPPTPMAESVASLILMALNCDFPSSLQSSSVLKAMFTELLSGPFSPQVKFFLIPILMARRPKLFYMDNILACVLDMEPNVWLLFCILKIIPPLLTNATLQQRVAYTKLLRTHATSLPPFNVETDDDSDDEVDEEVSMMEECDQSDQRQIMTDILDLINEPFHVSSLVAMIEETNELQSETIINLTCLCYSLLSVNPLPVHEYRLLYTLAFRSEFLRTLWKYIASVSTPSAIGPPTPLLSLLARGLHLAAVDWHLVLPQLTLFACLLSYSLPTIDDVEFYESVVSRNHHMPFSLEELQKITTTIKEVCIGLVELAYHDTRITVREDYKDAMKSVKGQEEESISEVSDWKRLFKSCVNLLKQLHHRDSRRPFCPQGHWISDKVFITVERPTDFRAGILQRRRYRQFMGPRRLTRQELETGGPPLSATEIKNITILQEMPFVVSFIDRFKIFQTLIVRDRIESRGSGHHFLVPGSMIDINIRRNYIYEDAYEKLSYENEPNIKKAIRVQLMNAVGLDEAGIDGGGIFREFLSELLKACFDPNRGFFIATHDRLLFPNPAAYLVCGRPEDCPSHFFFIGRMLGKALYENMLVELPFATFFLAKLLAKGQSSNVDVHHLATLDPTMYKNLMLLKNMDDESVADLGLDFTVTNADFGNNEEVELKPGGKGIQVTASNRIEYIHLMANYRLNLQLRPQIQAIKEGLANVIDLDWIRMFSPKELQILISGTSAPIDIEDLKAHTKYAGELAADHLVIQTFWTVVGTFDETQRRKLLKFVTSCSRPPLLGFKDLEPPFCIHSAGPGDRLPTASTCMNLLKLPHFKDEQTMRDKLLYAIESDVGFELS